MSFSILGKIRESEEERPEFYDDLNLTQWIEEINGQLGIYDLREYFRQMPDGREQIRFRQEVLQEIDEEIKRLQTATIGTTPQVQAFLEQHNSTLLKSGMTLEELLKRPEICYNDLKEIDTKQPELPEAVTQQVEISIKYEGYIKRQLQQVEQFKKLEKKKLSLDFDYSQIPNLRKEAIQKLNEYQPASIGQASRISGVSPADVSVLLVYLNR